MYALPSTWAPSSLAQLSTLADGPHYIYNFVLQILK